MENLVVSIFNTESEAYQSFTWLKAFHKTQTTRLLKSPWSKNENSHIVEKKNAMTLKIQRQCSPKGGLFGAVIRLGWCVLVMVWVASMVLAAGITIDTARNWPD